MLNTKDKGKMIAIMIGDHAPDEESNDGPMGAKLMANGLGIDLSDEDAQKVYEGFQMMKYACDAEEMDEEKEEMSSGDESSDHLNSFTNDDLKKY